MKSKKKRKTKENLPAANNSEKTTAAVNETDDDDDDDIRWPRNLALAIIDILNLDNLTQPDRAYLIAGRITRAAATVFLKKQILGWS